MKRISLLFFLILLAACSPTAETPTGEPAVLSAFYSPSAAPYLKELYECSNRAFAAIELDAAAPDIYLQLGEPENSSLPLVQIGKEEIVVVVGPQSNVSQLSEDEVQNIFAGHESALRVWGYESAADVQRAFEQLVMKDGGVTPANIALNPAHLMRMLGADPEAIGFLPKSWLDDSVRVVYSAGEAPVLALIRNVPDEVRMRRTLACMQRN